MRILNYGSLNLDNVYSVNHIVQPGETISSTSLEIFCGGKGLNQSVALARAGAHVFHAGMIGSDGEALLEVCRQNGVNTGNIRNIEGHSGHAIIQVSAGGQNSIVLYGGANQKNEKAYVDRVFSEFQKGDWLLLQNEVNLLDYMIERAASMGMLIALNPSPFNERIKDCDLQKVSLFLLNEIEGEQITSEKQPDAILESMLKMYPKSKIVLTLGHSGVIYADKDARYNHGVYKVPVVDTTAAGDTFTGYFLANLINGKHPEEAIHIASLASSLAVSKKGAVDSIPWKQDVENATF